MVATDGLLEDHVTTAVRSRVVPSENTPVALKAWARATAGTAGLLGVTSSDTSTAFVTVSVVEPEIEPNCAEIWVVPGDFPVATPFEPAAFEMVATDGLLEDHVTTAVRSRVVPSENTPVALKAWAHATARTPDCWALLRATPAQRSSPSALLNPRSSLTAPKSGLCRAISQWQRHSSRHHSRSLYRSIAGRPRDHSGQVPRCPVRKHAGGAEGLGAATAGTARLLGVTSSDTSTAFVTVSVVEPEIEPGSDASEVPAIASIPVKSQARKNKRGSLRAVVSFDCFILSVPSLSNAMNLG